MGKATLTTELIVNCKNEVGALAKCLLPFKQSGLNIECCCCYPEENNAKFHFVTNNNPKTKEVLTKNGWKVTENPVVLWTASNTPGGLATATSALAEGKVDITYCYCATPAGNTAASVVFCTNNNNKANEILNKVG